ncbi:MAG: hypothetical protein WA431_16115 [Candidatus Cybelea sp.]
MVALSSTGVLLAAMAHAKDIAIEAYTLHGPVLGAAESAASRGAHVVVRLAGHSGGDRNGQLARENEQLVAQLRADGVDATLENGLHAKEVRVDGTLYLDGKNWHEDDLVLRDADAADASISATKFDALDGEGRLLRGASAGDRVLVESESFGCCNAVYGALAKLGSSGAAPRLLVSERVLHGNVREQRALDRLVGDGVGVRVCKDSEKLAAVGDRAWAGSANATVAFGKWNAIDWGICTGELSVVQAVRDRLESQWAAGRDFEPHDSRATAR